MEGVYLKLKDHEGQNHSSIIRCLLSWVKIGPIKRHGDELFPEMWMCKFSLKPLVPKAKDDQLQNKNGTKPTNKVLSLIDLASSPLFTMVAILGT